MKAAIDEFAGRVEFARGIVRMIEAAMYEGNPDRGDVRMALQGLDGYLDTLSNNVYDFAEGLEAEEAQVPEQTAQEVALKLEAIKAHVAKSGVLPKLANKRVRKAVRR